MAKEKIDTSEIDDAIEKLTWAFDSKIMELHEVKGGQTERHAFMYYRELLWKILKETNKLK